jgi:hypothetical protein
MRRIRWCTRGVILIIVGCGADEQPATAAKPAGAPQVAEAPASSPSPTPSPSPSRPELDAHAATKAVDVMSIVPEAQRPALAARALSEIEVGRIPAPALQVLQSLEAIPPEQRGLAIAKALSEPELLGALEAACKGKGREAMQTAAEVAPEQRGAGLYATCELQRVGLMSAAEAKRAEPLSMLLAHVLAWHLHEGGGSSAEEKALLKAFAG